MKRGRIKNKYGLEKQSSHVVVPSDFGGTDRGTGVVYDSLGQELFGAAFCGCFFFIDYRSCQSCGYRNATSV